MPGAHLRALTPGLAPEWGPGEANPGDITESLLFFLIEGVLSLRTCLLWETLPGTKVPDNW